LRSGLWPSSQDGDIPKYTLQGLVEDIAHLVLKVLSRNERIDQVLPEGTFESDDLATGATDRRVDVERFPEVVDRVWSGLGADI